MIGVALAAYHGWYVGFLVITNDLHFAITHGIACMTPVLWVALGDQFD